MWRRILLLLFAVTALVSCASKGTTYRIGIDSSWFPLNLMGKETNVYTFFDELFRAISAEEGIFFERINANWDNLIIGLEKNEYDGMLSSIEPRNSIQKVYDFSDLILNTGPVLVVQNDVKVSSLGDMSGMKIAVDSLAGEALLTELYPDAHVHYFNTISEGLNELVSGHIDGIIIDYIPAATFTRGLYEGKAKIASPPLNDDGVRLIAIHGENKNLINTFNRGLSKLYSNGGLEKLLKKWDLN